MKVIVACAESEKNFEIMCKAGIQFCLMNNLYIKSEKNALKLLKKAKELNISVLMDSGTFAFKQQYIPLYVNFDTFRYDPCVTMSQESLDQMANALKKEGITREIVQEKAEKYASEYIKRVPMYYEYVECMSELDVDLFYSSYDQFKTRLRNLFDPFKDKVIYTPHLYNSSDVYMELFNNGVQFLGLSGGDESFFNTYWKELAEKKIKVHGWASTNYRSTQMPYYSIDSSSWQAGSRFGITYLYRGDGKLDNIENKARRAEMEEECKEAGVNFKLFLEDDRDQVDLFNLHQWAKFQEDMAKRVDNAYWMSAEEKNANLVKEREITALVNQRDREIQPVDIRMTGVRFCNSCPVKLQCPNFELNARCNIGAMREINTTDDLLQGLKGILSANEDRIAQAMWREKLQGISLDANLSKEIMNHFSLSKGFLSLVQQPQEELNITAKSSKPGIIAEMMSAFMGGGKKKKKQDEIVSNVVKVEEN